ncbi:hypothetical protein PUMCH_003490 [Australozyma saopauloensis]|uniref:Uncharacterized protein n=1 Tax=Australozyma saopauloensis TaxID=291208 RepID=A0AAX4HCQ8_9ASCO|nr:hypothetical protein PUMCH_003490 [[Candida] saopauloensis]
MGWKEFFGFRSIQPVCDIELMPLTQLALSLKADPLSVPAEHEISETTLSNLFALYSWFLGYQIKPDIRNMDIDQALMDNYIMCLTGALQGLCTPHNQLQSNENGSLVELDFFGNDGHKIPDELETQWEVFSMESEPGLVQTCTELGTELNLLPAGRAKFLCESFCEVLFQELARIRPSFKRYHNEELQGERLYYSRKNCAWIQKIRHERPGLWVCIIICGIVDLMYLPLLLIFGCRLLTTIGYLPVFIYQFMVTLLLSISYTDGYVIAWISSRWSKAARALFIEEDQVIRAAKRDFPNATFAGAPSMVGWPAQVKTLPLLVISHTSSEDLRITIPLRFSKLFIENQTGVGHKTEFRTSFVF